MQYTLTSENSVELAEVLQKLVNDEVNVTVNDRLVITDRWSTAAVTAYQNGTLGILVVPRRKTRTGRAQIFVKVGETFNVRSFG